MGGVCLLDKNTLEIGEKCTFELHDLDRAYYYFSRVAWKKDDRFALEFVEMSPDSSFFLQTMILSHADDSNNLVEEFQKDSSIR